MISEIVFLLFIWIVSILYLAMAERDSKNCYTCLDREGFISWFLIILMFLAFLLATILLLFLAFSSLFKPSLIEDDYKNYMQIEVKDDYKSKKDIVDDVLTLSKNGDKTYTDIPL